MFAEAIGLAPLKDTFHSITVQTANDANGDVPGDLFNEHWSELHAAVALFSKGPFVPGDRIGYENQRLLARAYNKDGLLLQMSESMKPLDTLMLAKARPDSPNGPPGAAGPGDRLEHMFGQRELAI